MSEGPQAGARVGGRYEIVAPISKGAMGAVFRARDLDGGGDVALKLLTDAGQAVRFEIEARLLARLRHPRVVRVLDHFEDGGSWLVMELVEGIDLGQLVLEQGPRPAAEAVAHVLQACEALEYIHAQQIVHRDVKPRNLLATAHGTVLVDFGIARELAGGDDPGTRAIGTPYFMAPEVLVGEAVSPRADVFGLAATLWTLLVGRPPSYHDPLALADEVPGVTPQLERAVRDGLELVPEKRIATATAFAAALGARLDSEAGASLAVSAEAAVRPMGLLEAIVRAAAGVFEAAAASIALVEPVTRELVYQAAWGAAAEEVIGVRLEPGRGIAGAAVADGAGITVPDCRSDPRFAARIAEGTGYVPNTMLVTPLRRAGRVIGALQLLDRRDGSGFGAADLVRAESFAELVVTALDQPGLGATLSGPTLSGPAGA